jgi:SAM-dependent methyltransferase
MDRRRGRRTLNIMSDTVDRFSNRVENYVKYRPGYPPAAVRYLEAHACLSPGSLVVDVGCGTGISSRPFLQNGYRVTGVEPNAAMRTAAARELSEFREFELVDGTSSATGLPDGLADMVLAAQAFHWFDPEATRAEFRRILKTGAYVALMWNERQLNTTPFLTDYEQLLLKYANDYGAVRHENVDAASLRKFFENEYAEAVFSNFQDFDLAGLQGRLLSSSYMPSEDDPRFPDLEYELSTLFAKHAENGRIKVFYDTKVYLSQV